LTGALGTSSRSLGNLLNNPVATLGAGLLLPFLQFNEMRFNNELAKARYEEAVVNFRQTLYQALVDVENALSARAQLNIQYALLQQSLTDARKTESIYEERYRAGEVPLKDWLDAQESRRSAEISLAANQLSRLQNQVMLYQALGGGV
jgi:outer membrane protein TolC